MAVIDNRTTQDGDVLYIETSIPAVGVTTLLGFVDETIEDNNAVFVKSFRYSKNGLTWSDWLELTIENIQAIDISKIDILYLHYRYKQKGIGQLSFLNISIDGEYADVSDRYYFNDSIFKKYFSVNNVDVLKWYVNVSEKLYAGELNKYVKFDDGNNDSTDAISFWQTIAKFFAFYVILSRIYGKFYLNEEIINEYLIQRGIFTSSINILSEYNKLMQNAGYEISKRGTNVIYQTKEERGGEFDGELRRYLNIDKDVELVFNYFLPKHCGWWVDEASPLYRGLENHLNANKLKYEQYNLTSNSNASIDIEDENKITILNNGLEQGLEYSSVSLKKLLNASMGNNYIIEFEIMANSIDSTLTVGIDCFDIDGNILPNSTTSFLNGDFTKYFIENLNLSQKIGIFVPIKCIVYNTNKIGLFKQDSLNINTGNNLKFVANKNIRKIYPIIKTDGDVEIKNVNVRHLYTNYERSFLNMNHFVDIMYGHTTETVDVITQNGFNYDFNIIL